MSRSPIGELKGITQSAIVALTRNGIITAQDLCRADIEHVAYLVDSNDIALTLFAEAEKVVAKSQAAAPPASKRKQTSNGDKPEPVPDQPTRTILLETLHLLAQVGGDALSSTPSVGLAQRLRTIGLVLGVGSGQTEALAALMLGAVGEEQPFVEPDEIASRFGTEVAELYDECAGVMGVPMSPTGGSQSGYAKTVAAASPEARLVVAAHAAATVRVILDLEQTESDAVWRRFPGGREITVWYYRAMRDALAAAGDVTFVQELEEVVKALEETQTPAKAA